MRYTILLSLMLIGCTYIEQSGDNNIINLDRDSGLLIGSGDTEEDKNDTDVDTESGSTSNY